jgi:hypothetical protein
MQQFPGPAPTTDAELAAWLLHHLDLRSPDEPLLETSSAPFQYLAHAFFEDRSPRDCVVWANRGGGKTALAAVATALDLIFKPGIEIRILAGSLEQSKRMHSHLRAIFDRPHFAAMLEGRITERRIALTNGSQAELLAQSQTSVRGTRVQKLRCDEVELFDPAVWDAAQLVTRSKECGSFRVRGSIECFSTMHVPYGIMHNLVGAALKDHSRKLFRWGVVDVLAPCHDDDHQCLTDQGPCPLAAECAGLAKARDRAGKAPGHITITDAIAMKARVSRESWNAEMLCLRPKRSDCVLPEFDPAIHTVARAPDISAAWPIVAGMDFGIRAPTVVLWARLGPDGSLVVVREHVQADRTLPQHIDSIRAANLHPQWIGVDPAGRARNAQTGWTDVQCLTDAGFVVRSARRPVYEGLGLVRARLRPALGPPTLTITKDCPHLIKSLEQYHYPADNAETDTPEKDGHDHAVDALRYLIQNLDAPYTTKHDRYG